MDDSNYVNDSSILSSIYMNEEENLDNISDNNNDDEEYHINHDYTRNIPISLNDSHSEISTLTYPTSLRNNATSTILIEEEHKEDNNIYNNDDTATHKCSDESLLSLLSSNNTKEAEESLSFHASMINTSCFTNTLTIAVADHDNSSDATNHDRIDVTNIVDIDDNAEQKQQHDDNSGDGDDVIIESIISEMENNTINNNNHDNDNNHHDPCIFHNIG